MSLILSGTDGLSDVDGSASTPAIRGTDANTGIFFPAADTIAFSEGGTESARFDSSGNLGIGTTSPANKLSVLTASGADGLISVTSPTTETAGVLVNGGTSSNKGAIVRFQKNASTKWTMGTDSAIIGGTSDNFHLYGGGADAMLFSTNATERMRITSDGLLQFNSGYGSVATAYGCRAWISFNGSSGAINGSGNISSVSNNATGDWTINFSTSMPDGNYSIVGMVRSDNDSNPAANPAMRSSDSPAAGSCRVFFGVSNSRIAFTLAMFAVFR